MLHLMNLANAAKPRLGFGGEFLELRIQAVEMVRGCAPVAAQQIPHFPAVPTVLIVTQPTLLLHLSGKSLRLTAENKKVAYVDPKSLAEQKSVDQPEQNFEALIAAGVGIICFAQNLSYFLWEPVVVTVHVLPQHLGNVFHQWPHFGPE